MVVTNTDVAIWYQAETNYAGGDDAGAIYTETDPNANDFTRVNFLAGDVKFKVKIFKRNKLIAPGIILGKGKIKTTGAEFPEMEFSYYLQTLADPFKSLSVNVAGNNASGKPGTTYIFQIQVPDPEEGAALVYNIFGAQMISYSITGAVDNDKPPIVTVKFSCYSIVINGGTVQTDDIPTGIINEWDDILVTLDTVPIVELKSFTITIENKFTLNASGRNSTFDKFQPLLVDKNLTYEIKFNDDAAALIKTKSVLTETLDFFTVIWTEGTNTITVTNCYIESDNFLEYTGDDITEVEYDITIKSGDSVFS